MAYACLQVRWLVSLAACHAIEKHFAPRNRPDGLGLTLLTRATSGPQRVFK
jgi:hypothetical protein